MKTEFECKFLRINKDEMRNKLTKIGFKCVRPEQMSRRLTYDIAQTDTYSTWIRLRAEGDKATLALKHKNKIKDDINKIQEAESGINDFDAVMTILKEIGLKANPLQENMREVWEKDNIEICIDTWPGLQPFIEIESNAEDIVKNCANELGFNWEDAIFGAVDSVYEKELGLGLKDFENCCTFNNPPKAKI